MFLELTGAQRALKIALDKRSVDLGTMYIGGLHVLADDRNPDRIALCAHSLRELIEKLPEHFDVPTKARGERLGSKVSELKPLWERAQKSNCHRQGVWDGTIDGPLKALLARIATFFTWLDQHKPRRRDESVRALRSFDASGRGLPAPLESLNVKAWDDMREFFVSVAHHGKRVEQDEFDGWVDALERFLLDRFVPRTFDDFNEIDALLTEGDADA